MGTSAKGFPLQAWGNRRVRNPKKEQVDSASTGKDKGVRWAEATKEKITKKRWGGRGRRYREVGEGRSFMPSGHKAADVQKTRIRGLNQVAS